MRKWRGLVLAFLLIPLVVGAETISWTPNSVYKDGSGSFTSAEMATMTFYLRVWKVGSPAKTYFGETRNGGTSWTDNILVKANQWGASSAVSGWVALKPGDNILVSVSMAFKDANGTEADSLESSGYAWTLPGGVVPPPVAAPTATLTAAPASIVKGTCAILTWATTNATSIAIDQGVGTVAASGTKSVCPITNTTYSITAVGQGGSKVATVAITVTVPPVITPGCSPPTGITIKP
jgi:hypothetical protein